MFQSSMSRTRKIVLLSAFSLAAARVLPAQAAPLAAFEGVSLAVADPTDVSRLTDEKGSSGTRRTPIAPSRSARPRSSPERVTTKPPEFSTDATPAKHAAAGFPAYHLYLFNTTGAAATVNVYVNPTRD